MLTSRQVDALRRAFSGDRDVLSYIWWRMKFHACRPFKRGLFRLQSGGLDLDHYDPFHLSFRRASGRQVVSDAIFAADTAVILAGGQSNIANEGDPGALFEPAGGVFNFNVFDGKCYVARDPLLGSSINRSNLLTRLGSLLVERGIYPRVLLVPVAHGGTSAQDWTPAGWMFPRLQLAIDRLRDSRIAITHILWQQGEAEAALDSPDAAQWTRDFMSTLGAIRASGVDAPIYVAQCTISHNDANPIIRAAQRGVVDAAAKILPGPDLDQIGFDGRFDRGHFNAAGLQRAAELWYTALRG